MKRDEVKLKDKARNVDKEALLKGGSSQPKGSRQKQKPNLPHPFARQAGERWSEEEEEVLKRGVKDFGTSWVDILKWMPVLSRRRTASDLADKWKRVTQAAMTFAKGIKSPRKD